VTPFQVPEVEKQPEPEPMEVDKSVEVVNKASPVKETTPPPAEQHEPVRRSSRSPRKDRREERENRDSHKDSSATEEHVPKEKPPKEAGDKKPIQRKRKWLSRKSSDTKPSVITISTDSLKNIISDVKPVPLADVRLESSSDDNEDVVSIEPEGPRLREKSRSSEVLDKEEPKPQRADRKASQAELPMAPEAPRNRKVSIVEVDAASTKVQRPPTPSKRDFSNILYITNLVRPFTVLQLKGLLARTGKIVENGFWIDKIKSKCYVKYDTEE
jgi:apoptotic chromatin condensation inducer in the nucleus